MDQQVLFAVAIILLVAVAVGIWLTMRRRHTDHLRDRFGDEYDRTLDDAGDRAKAEAALAEREKRVDALDIRPLTAAEHASFAEEWRDVKAVFVDSPVEAVHHADRMLATMMKTVGYPMADFDRRYEDLTVNHGHVARHYREGHSVVARHGEGSASTEDMRQAMKHYEALFDHLVSDAEQDATDRTHSTAPTEVAPSRAVDVDNDGDVDIVRVDANGDGHRESTRVVRD